MSGKDSNKHIINNFAWSFAERIGARGVSLIVSIVIARMVGPEDFGYIALVMVFINLLQVFVDSGFGNALIQKKDADNLDYCTVFFFNFSACVFLYGLIYFCAPFIASFCDNPSLTGVIRVLSICIIIYGLKNVQQAYVSKHLLFKKFFFSTLGGTLASAVVGILLAVNGWGIWALVFQHLTNVTIDTIVLWITVHWRPTLSFSFERLKKMVSYGWKILVSNVLESVYTELRQLLVGKVYSPTDLGYFNRGQVFPELIVTNVDLSIDSVLFPVLSGEQENKIKMRSIVKRAITTSVYVMAPMMIGLIVVAPQLITVFLTEKWLPCVPYLRVFCVIYLFYPIHTANLNAIKAVGRSDIFLKQEILKVLAGVVVLVATLPFGIMIMSYGMILVSFLSQMINAWPNRKLISYTYLQQIRDILPSILISLVMGVVVYLITFLCLSPGITLLIQIILGAVVYLTVSFVTKTEPLVYLIGVIKNRRKNKDV